jgi:hypothetical protein
MDFDALLDSLISDCDMRSELDRRRTFLKCVEYADTNVDADQYNSFLMRAAERLGQAKLMREAMSLAVRTTGDEKLHLRFDENEGVQIIGNQSGLLYLSRVLKNLSQARSAGEHITLGYGEKPLIGESYPLAAYVEDDSYFTDIAELIPPDGSAIEPELNKKEINPNDIAAFYIIDYAPEECGLLANTLYPVAGWEKYVPGMLVWRKELRLDMSRVLVLRYIASDGEEGRLAVDIDDPDIGFITFTDIKRILKARV